jgi:hypothetical protein
VTAIAVTAMAVTAMAVTAVTRIAVFLWFNDFGLFSVYKTVKARCRLCSVRML